MQGLPAEVAQQPSLWQEEWQEATLSLCKWTSNHWGRAQRKLHVSQPLPDTFPCIITPCSQNDSGRWGPALLLPHSWGSWGQAVPALTQGHAAGGRFKACPSFHTLWQQVHKLGEESAINGHIVCALSRTMTPGDTFICVSFGSHPTSLGTFERERHHGFPVFVYPHFWNHD